MIDIRSGCCPLCDHREIIEAIAPDFGDGSNEVIAAVTYEPRAIFPGRNPNEPHGVMHRYVCRSCGYCQVFAENPGDIPIGEEYRTTLVRGPEPGSPYR